MQKIIIVFIGFLFGIIKPGMGQQEGVYQFSLKMAKDSSELDLSQFKDHKILLVNISSQSDYNGQLGHLANLQEKFKDSGLVIIAVPSSDFTLEPYSDPELNRFIESTYHGNYIITQRVHVQGDSMHPLFHWLSDKSSNGALNCRIKGDFTKILINETGEITGVFNSPVSPEDPVILNGIRQ